MLDHDYHEEAEEIIDPEPVSARFGALAITVLGHAAVLILLMFMVFFNVIERERAPIDTQTLAVVDPPDPQDQVDPVVEDVVEPVDIEIETVEQQVDISVDPVEIAEVNESIVLNEVVAEQPSEQVSDPTMDHAQADAFFVAIGAGSGNPGGGGGGPFIGRNNKKQLSIRHKAPQDALPAVERALGWFAMHQSPNGMWDVDGYANNCADDPKCEPGSSHTGRDGDVACTSYALLCFLGAGYDHRTAGKYRETVRAGLQWLIDQQDANGRFGPRNYDHAVAVLAVAEALAMTEDSGLREPLQSGLDVMIQAQCPMGGWNYVGPSGRNDSSVTGWNVMALKSSKIAGMDVDGPMDRAAEWLETTWQKSNPGEKTSEFAGRFPYVVNEDGSVKGFGRECIGLVCGVFLGRQNGDELLTGLSQTIIADDLPASSQWPLNTYYVYYNMMGIFQIGGADWDRWNKVVPQVLVDAQRKDGCFNGSWDFAGTKFHGHKTGRLLSTAYACLSLEVYYRYDRLPLNAKS